MVLEIPIIIGVGDIKNQSTRIEDAKEPAQLMYEAIQAAIHDSGSSDLRKLQESIDSVDVVKTWTWPYRDLPGLLAEKLKITPIHKHYSEHGGDKPGKLFDEAARRICLGDTKVAVITGGEALASLSTFAAAKKLPPPGWTTPSQAVNSVFTASKVPDRGDLGTIHDIGAPIHIYPLYENAFRAHRGQSLKANHEESAKLYSEFSAIAENHPCAWNQGRKDDEKTIRTINKKNRMICFPYPLLMNAFNTVNLAAACILTSVSFAKTLGVPEEKWVYPLGGAGTMDSNEFWLRPNFYSSPSISRSIDAALSITATTASEIDLFDIYSCFPIVPKLAAQHLGIPIVDGEKPLSLLGGLTSFGGAGNNYSMHALVEMTRQIRSGRGKKGLVLCNGGVLSYQYVFVLGKEPRKEGRYPERNPLPEKVDDVECPELAVEAEGDAIVETYTVEYNRDGSPLRGYVIGRLKKDGKRFLANSGDEKTLMEMASGAGEIVGLSGWFTQDAKRKGRGLFTFDKLAKL